MANDNPVPAAPIDDYAARRHREIAAYNERADRWAKESKVLKLERCLWAWRYWFKWNANVFERERAIREGHTLCPVDVLMPQVGGWTFCGRRTVRVISPNEADLCEAAGIEWHAFENEPSDARRATEPRLVPLSEQPEVLTAASLSLHAPVREVTCGKCLVSCDVAAERGHLAQEERLGEVALRLRPFPDRPFAQPRAEWWQDGIYRPDRAR